MQLLKFYSEPPIPQNFILPLRIITAALLLAMFLTNGLANALGVAGNTVGGVSDKFFTFITPAGYAFSIWGLIYTFIAVYAIYQLIPMTYDSPTINEGYWGGVWLCVNAIANSAWIVVWLSEMVGLALFFMLIILLSLARIYVVLKTRFTPTSSWVEWACTQVGVSLYFAWIIAATFLNIYALATNAQDTAYIPAAIAGLCLAGAVESAVSAWARDPIVSGVGTWALVAIGVNWREARSDISTTAFVIGGLLAAQTVALTAWHAYVIFFKKSTRGQVHLSNDTDLEASNESLK